LVITISAYYVIISSVSDIVIVSFSTDYIVIARTCAISRISKIAITILSTDYYIISRAIT
jgi:hypothetical protein